MTYLNKFHRNFENGFLRNGFLRNGFLRREFIGGCATLIAGLGIAGCSDKKHQHRNEEDSSLSNLNPASWWIEDKYVRHETVDVTMLSKGIIRGRVEGRWQNFKVAQLPDKFVHWSLNERINRLEKLATHGFDIKDLDGPHNACVATYGGWMRDSAMSLNTAYKGMGFVPCKGKIAATIKMLKDADVQIAQSNTGDFMAAMAKKTKFLGELYKDASLFDRTKQVSLELFTSPVYATHTFLNMMANPIASASFLAYPTFELRTIPQLLHPRDPFLSVYEKQIVDYTNAVHDFVHGGDEKIMTCLYHVTEMYDDTPNGEGHGTRIA